MPCVLVADDTTEFAEMLRATLEEAGFEVVTAYSGPAALAAMGTHEVDAAVLDALMPGISGDAAADRLRRLYPELPIVLMTGERACRLSQRRTDRWRGENRSATRNSSTRSAACSNRDPRPTVSGPSDTGSADGISPLDQCSGVTPKVEREVSPHSALTVWI